MLARDHAKLTACFDSAVARARVVFAVPNFTGQPLKGRAPREPFYRIAMSPDDVKQGCMNGFLPKLRQARTHQGFVQYYIESTGRDLAAERTKLAILKIVDSAAECHGEVAESVPEADVNPMPVDADDPPFSQAAAGSHWEAGPGDERTSAPAERSAPRAGGGSGGKVLLGVVAVAAAGVAVAAAAAGTKGRCDAGDVYCNNPGGTGPDKCCPAHAPYYCAADNGCRDSVFFSCPSGKIFCSTEY